VLWSDLMLYNPTPTLIRLLLSFSCLLFIAVYGAAMLDNPLSVNLLARIYRLMRCTGLAPITSVAICGSVVFRGH
jgi:hypothetical protein